jgi:cell division protein FtsN
MAALRVRHPLRRLPRIFRRCKRDIHSQELWEDQVMRIFIDAVAAAVILAIIGALVLVTVQKPVSVAFSTNAVRLDKNGS